MLDELKWPSLEVRRDQSYLLLFHKIHCVECLLKKTQFENYQVTTKRGILGQVWYLIVSIPDLCTLTYFAQYRRHQTYSDALNNSFSPELFHIGIVFLLLWSIHSPQRSLGRKRTGIRNRYNQAQHLTQDTNGKVTTSQLDITNESQEVIPFPAGDHKASTNRRV